jgi:hypothetical protein
VPHSAVNFEASADYRDVQDPAITVTMPGPTIRTRVSGVDHDALDASVQPGRRVHPEIDYVKIRDNSDGENGYSPKTWWGNTSVYLRTIRFSSA